MGPPWPANNLASLSLATMRLVNVSIFFSKGSLCIRNCMPEMSRSQAGRPLCVHACMIIKYQINLISNTVYISNLIFLIDMLLINRPVVPFAADVGADAEDGVCCTCPRSCTIHKLQTIDIII